MHREGGSTFVRLRSSSLALIVLGLLYLLYYYNILSLGISKNVINVLFFRALGSYVSIWITNGKRKDDGYASKSLHYFESVSRIIVGMIFAIIAYCLFKCGLIFSREGMEGIPQFYPILGFVSGFFERFIPSLMTRYTNSIDDKNANKDDAVHKNNAAGK